MKALYNDGEQKSHCRSEMASIMVRLPIKKVSVRVTMIWEIASIKNIKVGAFEE